MPCSVPDSIMTDSGPQITSKLIHVLCALMRTKLIRTTEYRPEANEKVETSYMTLVAKFCENINEHQSNWESFVQLVVYGYKTQVHCTTKTSPFSVVLSREQPEAIMNPTTRIPEEYSTLYCTPLE